MTTKKIITIKHGSLKGVTLYTTEKFYDNLERLKDIGNAICGIIFFLGMIAISFMLACM